MNNSARASAKHINRNFKPEGRHLTSEKLLPGSARSGWWGRRLHRHRGSFLEEMDYLSGCLTVRDWVPEFLKQLIGTSDSLLDLCKYMKSLKYFLTGNVGPSKPRPAGSRSPVRDPGPEWWPLCKYDGQSCVLFLYNRTIRFSLFYSVECGLRTSGGKAPHLISYY